MVHSVMYGQNERKSYSRIQEILEMPNLIAVQKSSYKHFLDEGLKEVFKDISPITDYSGNLMLEFVDYYLENKTNYSIEECKERDATYASPLKVRVRVVDKETGLMKEDVIYFGQWHLYYERSGTRNRQSACSFSWGIFRKKLRQNKRKIYYGIDPYSE